MTIDIQFRPLADALSSRFTIERELGRGGMGVVFLARDLRLDRRVALKVLPPALAADAELRERFLREARTAGGLAHPNIVPIHAADEAAGIAYFAMGFVDGESLGDRVRARGALPAVDAVPVLRDTALALAYAHARGVVHRDVKPENILLEHPSGRAMVTDFGIARVERDPSLTASGSLVGTAAYMSPEQCSGGAIDGRSDLYALGVVAFYTLAGRLPFVEGNVAATLVAHVTKPAPALAAVAPGVPPRIAEVVDRCLRKSPDERWTSGEALAEAFDDALASAERDAMTTPAGPYRRLTEEQAAMVWRRAAQLQADASSRLERDAGAAAQRAAEGEVGGDNAYRLRDVESAAVEAGISQRFVALAVSELPASPSQTAGAAVAGGERMAAFMLGATSQSLQVSRTFRAPARDVLTTLGRCFRGAPWNLQYRAAAGPHPLAGGVIEFIIPPITATGGGAFRNLRYGLYVPRLRCSLRAVSGDVTEVTVYADLREGLNTVLVGWGLTCGVFGTVGGGAIGFATAVKGLALIGLAAGTVATAGIAAGGVVAVAVSRWGYRWGVDHSRTEIEELLESLSGALASPDIFGDEGIAASKLLPSANAG